MKIMYLDESGSHNLRVVDPDYPIFVLGGIIVDTTQALGDMEWRIKSLKRRHFGRDGIILHSTDIHHAKRGFERLADPNRRDRFYLELSNLLQTLDYQIVACAIDKTAHVKRYKKRARDPYYYALSVLVERFYLELQEHGKEEGTIIAEKRNELLDDYLAQEWKRLNTQGTGPLNPKSLQEVITSLDTRAKSENIAGLQVADIVLASIGRELLGLAPRLNYSIIEGKYRKNSKGDYKNYGLKLLP